MLYNLLIHRSSHLSGKVYDLKEQIYDLKSIPVQDLISFINRAAILHKKIIRSKKTVTPNLLF